MTINVLQDTTQIVCCSALQKNYEIPDILSQTDFFTAIQGGITPFPENHIEYVQMNYAQSIFSTLIYEYYKDLILSYYSNNTLPPKEQMRYTNNHLINLAKKRSYIINELNTLFTQAYEEELSKSCLRNID